MPAARVLAASMLALATACPATGRGTEPWSVEGAARTDGDTVFLTDGRGGAGSAWSTYGIDATGSFRMGFTCRLQAGTSGGRSSILFAEDRPPSSDQGTGALAGVEFRTDGTDPMEDSIALIRRDAGGEIRTIQSMPAGNLDNGLVHSLSISWDEPRGRLFVWLDGMEEPVLASFERDFFSGHFSDPSDLGWGAVTIPGVAGALLWIVPERL